MAIGTRSGAVKMYPLLPRCSGFSRISHVLLTGILAWQVLYGDSSVIGALEEVALPVMIHSFQK